LGSRSLICLLVIILIASGFTQESNTVQFVPQKENEFQSALETYRSGDYRSALSAFESLANSNVLHQRMTAALLMTGKSLYHLERYSDATSYFDELIRRFPRSEYVDDAGYFRGGCDYQQGEYFKAARNFLWVIDWSPHPQLLEKSKRLARAIIFSELSMSEAQNLLRHAGGEQSAGVVTLGLAQKELLQGSSKRVVKLLEEYRSKYGENEFSDQIDQLLTEARGVQSLKFGVVLPLTGLFSEEGLGILQGIKFAHSQSSGRTQIPVQLLVRDSESNMITAIKATQNLINREHVRAIIGELESEVTAGVGALASVDNVPLVAPAATENQVASVGKAVYQLNSDLERKGEALAEYAFQQLGLRTFATLAPADGYGQQMTASFTSRIDELGGRIIAQSWFYGDGQDLSRQFKMIREAAFHYDSTDVEKLIEEAEKAGEKLEEKDIPVLSIDAVFFPIYSEHIPYVAPQFALSNIQAQVLGGEYWDAGDLLQRSQIQPYVNGAIFVSDYFPQEDNPEFRDFRTQFRLQMKKTPERWEIFGYDAFQVLAQAINDGAKTSGELNSDLSTLQEFRGMKGEITFKGNNRVNSEVNFLQFVNGRIIKHQLSR